MSGFLTRWMIARSLDEGCSTSTKWVHSRDGGEYAQELRDVGRRLRNEADMDQEEPRRELREQTLDAIHGAYLFPRQTLPSTDWPLSARAITRAAACFFLLVGGFIAADQFGSSLWQQVQSFGFSTQPRATDVMPNPATVAAEPAASGTGADDHGLGVDNARPLGSDFHQLTMDSQGRDAQHPTTRELTADRSPAIEPNGDGFP